MPLRRYESLLTDLYERLNRRQYVHPDPLEFLYPHDDPADREIVGLVASSLAYGRVQQILKSVRRATEIMGPHPARYVRDGRAERFARDFSTFKHRFTEGSHVAAMLAGVSRVLKRCGSIEACFVRAHAGRGRNVLEATTAFVAQVNGDGRCGHLLPDPARRSACKRLNLFLRWMVRRDEVDVGHWKAIDPAALLVPLDVHMHRIATALGATRRRQADLTTVLEVTSAFAKVAGDDPVRYDFCLTRLGIHPGEAMGQLRADLERAGKEREA